MNQCLECGMWNHGECLLAPAGPDHKAAATARVEAIEDAYAKMQRHGMGFQSDGSAFGDPRATFTIVGPFLGGLVESYAMDADCVKAVELAMKVLHEKKRLKQIFIEAPARSLNSQGGS